MEAWPGGQLEGHVGPGGGGASGWPHPSLWLPSSHFVPGTLGTSARLLGLQAHLPLCSNKVPLPKAWLS